MIEQHLRNIVISGFGTNLRRENELVKITTRESEEIHFSPFFARVIRSDYNMITNLWRRQIVMGKNRRMEIAKEIVDCAIYNKLRILQSLAKNREVDFSREMEYLNGRRESLKSITDDERLMGIEGDATRRYFGALRRIIPEEFGFERRERRPPHDPVNSMLSYGYTVLKSRWNMD
jgi:CRISPR-associated protein Cas1